MPSIDDAVAFLESQRVRQSPTFAPSQGRFVLSFLGTTNARGVAPALTVHELFGVAPVGPKACRLDLSGDVRREPARGESITVSVTDWPRYRGYQLKTAPATGAAPLVERPRAGRVAIVAAQVFTVHHSPNTVHMFEDVPLAEVEETVRVVRRVVVGVGPMVNISPRFVICWEVRNGVLSLFHGDGEANKTWMNLSQNDTATHAIHDQETGEALTLEGTCREVARAQHPERYDELCHHYVRIGYGLPSRVYRFQVGRVAAA